MITTKEQNKELCKKFPFLTPRDRWTGEVPEDFNYSFTELDAMPDGWRKVFGEQMCQEIKEALEKINYLDKYRITLIKEKYGALRWYDFGGTEETYKIIRKYSELSKRTCIECGQPAKCVTLDWISPYCEKCVEGYHGPIMNIGIFYNDLEGENK